MEKNYSMIRVRMSRIRTRITAEAWWMARNGAPVRRCGHRASDQAGRDEGLFLKYTDVQFLAPTYAGDYIEAYGEIYEIGTRQGKCGLKQERSSRQGLT